VRRRRDGEPAEYILGWVEFAGVRLAVGPGVFIPRRWSESMMLRAVELLDAVAGDTAVDLGTGSGAIALAIHTRHPDSTVLATDSSPKAAAWATRNCAGRSGLEVHVGDLYDALPGALEHQVDVIVGSLPYVPADELAGLPRDHLITEPPSAFDGGAEGLAIVGRALAEAPRWLRPSGSILLEIGHSQGAPATAMAAAAGLSGARIHRDGEGGELFLEARSA
jgi:release factor glutamine methyltransferase